MGYYGRRYSMWPQYVSIAERKEKALKKIQSLKKKGQKLQPIVIEGKTIAKTFWGKAWCTHLESYSDYENRLPRGRSYVRNGFVIDLHIHKGKIEAQVLGSSLYTVSLTIQPMAEAKWQQLVKRCSGKIDSLIELLQGKFSKSVMETLTEKEHGLFPHPHEIALSCSCPDYAGMCKHVAATLYGVGASLDLNPELLFTLRHVDHLDLLSSTSTSSIFVPQATQTLEESELSSLFGIDLADTTPSKPIAEKKKRTARTKATTDSKKTKTEPAKKKTTKKTTAKKKTKTAERKIKEKNQRDATL